MVPEVSWTNGNLAVASKSNIKAIYMYIKLYSFQMHVICL